MRKRFSFFLCMFIVVITFTGCISNRLQNEEWFRQDDKLNIVCTTFPQYDWTKQVIKGQENRFQLTFLFRNGADLHSFQPTADDMISVASADLVIYVGGETDEWLEEAMENAVNPKIQAISMLDCLKEGLKEEEAVEGMQENRAETFAELLGAGEDGTEYDEHVWLSLGNARVLTVEIADRLGKLDPESADFYKTNAEKYCAQLEDLEEQYAEMVLNAELNTILVADRYPFRYLSEECGINYYAAFPGCSADSEASFETVTFLSGKADELGLDKVLILENTDGRIADAVIRNTKDKNQEILVLNSLQSVRMEDVEKGFSYYEAMEENLEVLGNALKSR